MEPHHLRPHPLLNRGRSTSHRPPLRPVAAIRAPENRRPVQQVLRRLVKAIVVRSRQPRLLNRSAANRQGIALILSQQVYGVSHEPAVLW